MENREIYKWNPVFNMAMKIKDEFRNKFNNITYDIVNINGKELTCIEYWIYKLNNPEYNSIFSILQTNQYNDLILFRYGSYSDIYNGESEITPDKIWDVYSGFYRECRSLVINIKTEEIVLCPFKKFRNINEGEENSLENIRKRIESAKSVEITNKLDGSMQSARFYNDRVVIA